MNSRTNRMALSSSYSVFLLTNLCVRPALISILNAVVLYFRIPGGEADEFFDGLTAALPLHFMTTACLSASIPVPGPSFGQSDIP